jgi:hypothetical protein
MAREVRKIDFADRVLVTTDDQVLPIAHLFDKQGLETQDRTRAVMCIAGKTGQWLSLPLGEYRKSALH